jgi:hypothetical protein
MEGHSDKDLAILQMEARREDLAILLDLETRCIRNMRLTIKQTITLHSLRDFYASSSRKIRDELLIGEKNEEDLLLYVLTGKDSTSEPDPETQLKFTDFLQGVHKKDEPDCEI